jgi:hypothetical protein
MLPPGVSSVSETIHSVDDLAVETGFKPLGNMS